MNLIDYATKALGAGHVVAVPTDTVYGFAVDPFHEGAVGKLFDLKGRGRDVPIAVLVEGLDQARALAGDLPPAGRRLAERFWPGALTLVVSRRPDVDIELGGDGKTVGLRWPAHPVPRVLCKRVGPLATTSANRHGEAPLPSATAIAAAFGDRLGVVLPGGEVAGQASTVVDCTETDVRLVREGAIAWSEIEAAL